MPRGLKWTGLAVLAALVAVQFVPVERTNPPADPAMAIERHLPVPAEVKAVLDRSCGNCHTNQTEWPLYSYVAPLSWDIVGHVNHARQEMNFSEWGTYDSDTVQDKLIALCRRVRSGEMPLPSYSSIHRSARLSPEDVTRLCEWASATRKKLREAE